MTNASFEECAALIAQLKREKAETRRLLREIKAVNDQISFLRSWLRIISKKPEYVA